MMKKLLNIVSILILFLLSQDAAFSKNSTGIPEEQICISNYTEPNDLQQQFNHFELNKNNDAYRLFVARNFSTAEGYASLLKTANKLSYFITLKEQNRLQKTSEIRAYYNILNYSTLRNRTGHQVYVLRKIVI
ncbi:hypothetical protein [Parabacteroides chongii]|uniref:hypothetical protein n=1 Tax=Parabacteroides chongii TaxID=2685834 RepID=UPI00240D2CB3|nr:hypothetical protein [Parabacteroides chongii]WFE85335.1 hypothetical protein P3L47_01720 [Parabacteroides chongii]